MLLGFVRSRSGELRVRPVAAAANDTARQLGWIKSCNELHDAAKAAAPRHNPNARLDPFTTR